MLDTFLRAAEPVGHGGVSNASSMPADIPAEINSVLHAMNGFFLFDRAFHFRGSSTEEPRPIEQWNREDGWKSHYGSEQTDYYFFADDVFGNQFGMREGKIFLWNAETCHAEIVAPNLEAFWEVLAFDTDYLTGRPLAIRWKSLHGLLPFGERLGSKRPFFLGGEYELDNLYSLDEVALMLVRADVYQQTRNLPDGAKVRLFRRDKA